MFKPVRIISPLNKTLNLTIRVDLFEEDLLPFILERNPDNQLKVNLPAFIRPCIRGEGYILGDSQCRLCAKGEFSLEDPFSKEGLVTCSRCPENAVCNSGDSITPVKGFWRANAQSKKIVECYTAAFCLGDTGGLETYSEVECIVEKIKLNKNYIYREEKRNNNI